jgi:RHS repeat-associated protein
MNYDAAGNLINDTYTNTTYGGTGQRNYDAENRMFSAQDVSGNWSYYAYNADAQRVRRKVNGKDTWQIYGMEGELMAEYDANAVPSSAPLKEYAYRNGQLLSTTDQVNLALNKPATQSSTHHPTTPASKAVDGNTNGTLWGGYSSATNGSPNAWWQVDLGSVQSIGAVQVWGRTDCCLDMTTNYYVFVSDNPFTSTDLNTTLNQPGVSNYYVPGYSGTPGTVNANRTGRYVRVQLAGTNYLVLGEVKVLRNTADVNWLVTDHLGTPRMVFDKTGSFASTKRHDYLPFGEEISAYGGRTSAQGYVADGLRQQFTAKERDLETGLDYFGARYYASTHGRFTSPDPFSHWMLERKKQDQYISNPQRWNKYSYVLNNPLHYVDPTGLAEVPAWKDLNKNLRDDLAKRLGKDAQKTWDGWSNDQRQGVLNLRADLSAAGVWDSVATVTYGALKVEDGWFSNSASFTPNNSQGSWTLAITTTKDIKADLEKAGFEDRLNANHPENQLNYYEKGDGIVLHLGTLIPPDNKYTTGHFDRGGGRITNSEHFSDYWNRTGPSHDAVTTALGQTRARQYLIGVSNSMDKLLTQPKK